MANEDERVMSIKLDEPERANAKVERMLHRDQMRATIEMWRVRPQPPGAEQLGLMQIEAIINLAETVEALSDGGK